LKQHYVVAVFVSFGLFPIVVANQIFIVVVVGCCLQNLGLRRRRDIPRFTNGQVTFEA